MENFNYYVSLYKDQLQKGDIQIAYNGLVKFVTEMKTTLSKKWKDEFLFRNVFSGYMDYTYFYFSNNYLKERKLRFGFVLNQEKMQFELWLLGQNIKVQDYYWEVFKISRWNEDIALRPKYSTIEIILEKEPDFNNLDLLAKKLDKKMQKEVFEIIEFLKSLDA